MNLERSSKLICNIILLSKLTVVECFSPIIHTSFQTKQLKVQYPQYIEKTKLYATLTKVSNDTSTSPVVNVKERSKLRQLKDRMWVRETLEDLTTAEFATSLESLKENKVDFEALVRKLSKRTEDMCLDGDCLMKDSGMGSVVYNYEQREALLKRIVATRDTIYKLTQMDLSNNETESSLQVGNLDDIRTQLQDSAVITNTDADSNDLKVEVYVREDGTVDWDGALQDRAALKQFGSAVWARINGMDPLNLSEDDDIDVQQHASDDKVTAKIIETDAIKYMKAELDSLTAELSTMEKDHKALLISAVSEGSAVANINLATIDPSLRAQIRISDDTLKTKELEVTIQSLNYELERIFTYLEGEMGNTFAKGYIPLNDRLAVAEFGLLESQIDAINNQLKQNDSTIDEDVLAVVKDQMIDFKRRLGIDYYVTGVSLDGEAVQRFISDLVNKGKEGAAFYVKGCQLLWNDAVFCTYLFGRAVQGYTLKPREVRTLRYVYLSFFEIILTFIL